MADKDMSNDIQAFPVSTNDGFTDHGMSLRDYFAGQALTGIVGNVGFPVIGPIVERVASDAYALADAMLEARGEQP